jgi:colanic acid/amylovoran biosynthesis glycosyltransferase
MQKLRDLGGVSGPLVTFFHGYDVSLVLAELGHDHYLPLFAEGELFLPVSRFWSTRLIELGAPPSRVQVHRMGVDTRALSYHARPSLDRPFQILSVGRLVEKKAFDDGIRAFACLSEQIRNKVCYRIVGDGPLRPHLENLMKELGVAEQVQLLGWRSQKDISSLLSESHILLAPSATAASQDAEGVPVAIMEAMAKGLPVLSTYHSGIPELVEDGRSGFLVPEHDIELLGDRLQLLIESSKQSLDQMGRYGRLTVERDYDMDVLNDRLEERLTQLSSRVQSFGMKRSPNRRR